MPHLSQEPLLISIFYTYVYDLRENTHYLTRDSYDRSKTLKNQTYSDANRLTISVRKNADCGWNNLLHQFTSKERYFWLFQHILSESDTAIFCAFPSSSVQIFVNAQYSFTMDDEQLIEAVQRRRAIYDKNHPKHRNRDTLRTLWSECANELGTLEGEWIKAIVTSTLYIYSVHTMVQGAVVSNPIWWKEFWWLSDGTIGLLANLRASFWQEENTFLTSGNGLVRDFGWSSDKE